MTITAELFQLRSTDSGFLRHSLSAKGDLAFGYAIKDQHFLYPLAHSDDMFHFTEKSPNSCVAQLHQLGHTQRRPMSSLKIMSAKLGAECGRQRADQVCDNPLS